MEIQTVKNQKGGGYLVNGNMSVPNDPANTDYRAVQEWIAGGNAPEPARSVEEIRKGVLDAKLTDIHREAQSLLDAGALINGARYDVSDRSILKTLGVVAGVNAGKGLPRAQASITVRDKARTKSEMSAAQYLDFGAALRDYVAHVEQTADDHADAVLALFRDPTKAAADIDAYDITTGWPA